MLREVGLSSPRRGRQLQAECDRLGIDYGHFSTRGWTDQQLIEVLPTARGWWDVMAGLGYEQDSGSARATIRKHAARIGLDVSILSDSPAPGEGDPFTDPADPHHLRAAGAFIVAGACALRGYKVSWPLEPAVYDLLVDTGRVQRVQVKTTTWRLDGEWACKITHSESGVKAWYTDREVDYFAVVDGDLAVYMIPVNVVDGLGTIIVRKYDAYRLPAMTIFPVIG